MKRISLLVFTLLLTLTCIVAQVNPNKVWVNGYYRSNGTHVKGHYRTAPNHTVNDNYSTVGNVNPHTGKRGWIPRDSHVNPYAKRKTTTFPSTATRVKARTRTNQNRSMSSPSGRSSNNVSSSSRGYSDGAKAASTITGNSISVNDLSRLPLRYVNTTRLNVRMGPGTGNYAFLQAQRSSPVRILDKENYPWAKVVVYDGSSYAVGYVNQDYLSLTKPTAPPASSEATFTIRKFLNYIDGGKYEIAYGLSDNPNWGSLEWFSSAVAYGAVVGIEVKNIKLERAEGAEAVVYARYYAEDPANKTGVYEQRFYLDGTSGDWRIKKAKLISFDEDHSYAPKSDPTLLASVKPIIEAYREAVQTNDPYAISDFLAPYLDRFFDKGPKSKYDVIEANRQYLQRWETLSLTEEASSWVARRVPGGIEVSTTIELNLRKRKDGAEKWFRIRRIIILNENGLISHLDEVIIERK